MIPGFQPARSKLLWRILPARKSPGRYFISRHVLLLLVVSRLCMLFTLAEIKNKSHVLLSTTWACNDKVNSLLYYTNLSGDCVHTADSSLVWQLHYSHIFLRLKRCGTRCEARSGARLSRKFQKQTQKLLSWIQSVAHRDVIVRAVKHSNVQSCIRTVISTLSWRILSFCLLAVEKSALVHHFKTTSLNVNLHLFSFSDGSFSALVLLLWMTT